MQSLNVKIGGRQSTFKVRLDNNEDLLNCNEVVDFILYEKDRTGLLGNGKERKYPLTYKSGVDGCVDVEDADDIVYYISKQDNYFVSAKYTRCAIEYDYPILDRTKEWGLGERAGYAKLFLRNIDA